MSMGGGLTGLVGAGGAQGAFGPQAQQDDQKKRMLAQLFQAIQQSKQQGQQQGQGAPSALPGSPQGQGGPAGGLPSMDQMITQLMAAPGNNATKMQALEQYGAFASPFEKMQAQLTMKQEQITAASKALDEKLAMAKQLQDMRNQQSGSNNAANNATRERGQDVSATNTDKRVAATERGQDMRSDTSAAALEEKQRHEVTMENIANDKTKNQASRDNLKQKEVDRHNLAMEALGGEKADTAQYVANTGRERAVETGRHNSVTEGQGQQKINASGKLDEAKIKKMESSVSAENKKPFMAARDTYNKAASLYQSLTRPGATPAASSEDIAFAKDKMDKAQATMTKLAGSTQQAQLPEGLKPEDITPENLEHTAKVNGITVDEVKKRLGVQ